MHVARTHRHAWSSRYCRAVAARLVLGTAQFGVDYGVTNSRGRVPDDDLGAILDLAVSTGVTSVDTATEYGDAELRLRTWADRLRVQTKIRAIGGIVSPDITTSCERLGVESLDAALIRFWFELSPLEKQRAAEGLQKARGAGMISRIGASIYDDVELATVLDCFATPNVVQVPASVVDQRLVGSLNIRELRERGCTIQVRSAYLQGLLITDHSDHPDVTHFRSSCWQAGLDPLVVCLTYLRDLGWVDEVVVGVTSDLELRAALEAWQAPALSMESELWASSDVDLLDPRRWKRE